MQERIPLLFIGDSPSGFSGLGRILRDVALRTHEHLSDIYDVATLGLGAPPSPSLPLSQYPAANTQDWILHDLPWVWASHSKGREGIIFAFWDISRLLWMAFPEQCPDLAMQQFLQSFKGKKWIYPAVDGCGPNGGLSITLKEGLKKFDRVLNYTQFSARITGYPDVCTHGIDTNVFYPRENAREEVAAKFGLTLDPDEKLIGIVATNQPRKDWALAFETLAHLKQNGIKAKIWIHTDTDHRHWDLKALYVDFNLGPEIKVFITPFGIPDDTMAILYSACDVTLGIGPEGVGYPLLESTACGTPVVTGSYGGQSDFVPQKWLVKPKAYRYEGVFAVLRPVYVAEDFANQVERVLRNPQTTMPVWVWDDCWPCWEKWLREGL